MFYPSKLKKTYKETVGQPYNILKHIAIITGFIAALVFVYGYYQTGFLTLLISDLVYIALIRRESYIDGVQKIRSCTDLRLRLLLHRDSEFALENLKNDYIWREEPVDPEVEQRLNEIKKDKAETQGKLEKFLEELAKSIFQDEPKTETKKEGKPN